MSNSLFANKRLWVRALSLIIIVAIALLKPKFDDWMAGRSQGEGKVVASETSETPALEEATNPGPSSGDRPSLDDLLASIDDEPAANDSVSAPDLPTTRTSLDAGDSQAKTTQTQSGSTTAQKNQSGSSGKTDPRRTTTNSSTKSGGSDFSSKSKPSTTGSKPATSKTSGTSTADSNKEAPLGKLTLIKGTRDEFRSTAGLMYLPGSADGHRLKHVLKHAKDNPSKPVHGVFEGDRDQILAWIDRTYLMGKKGGRDVRTEKQRDRVVYTANLKERVGYVGGQKGKRNGNKECRYLRLVLENGTEVITAYPSDRM